MADRDDDARKANEARVKRTGEAKEAAHKLLKEQQEDQVKSNTEAMRRQNESQPTPTQQENDLARLGQHVMEKEDDGSGPDPTALSAEEQKKLRERRAAEAGAGSAPYRTRAAAPGPAAAPSKPVT